MKCPSCQQVNPPEAKFCLQCGTPFMRSSQGGASSASDTDSDLQRALNEAVEQQQATNEILQVIANSPADVQPVLNTILAKALRLCEAHNGGIFTFDGHGFRMAAVVEVSDEFRSYLRDAVILPGPETPLRRVGLEPRVSHVADILADRSFSPPEAYRREGMRTSLAVPMLKEGRLVGALAFHRRHVRPFAEKQIELIRAFAGQAVIAIENVRLFNELQARNTELTAALDQQTATGEILGVISRSPTDVQPIFDAIVRSASRLCGGEYAIVTRYDGEFLHLVAQHNPRPGTAEETATFFPQLPRREESPTARALVDADVVHIPDVESEVSAPSLRERHRRIGLRAIVAVPMVHEGRPIGVISVSRGAPGPFSDRQIALLQTFADQAVIAIENVRLFKELEVRNRDLTLSLDRQTATADVLRIIAQSPSELQPVLDAIAASAVRLCAASDAVIERLEGDRFYNAAHVGTQMKGLIGLPLPLTRRFPGGRAVLDREPVIIDDIQLVLESEFSDTIELQKLNTIHSIAEIPMLSEGRPLGSLAILRAEVRPFTEAEVALLKTFADQAVIAIENVRLFTELEARNREIEDKSRQLEAASQHKSEFLANMSHELRTPLNAVIGFAEVLTERMFGELNEKQDEYLRDIYASGQHLLSLINDILDLSKIEAGRMELELADFHLPQAIENALVLVRERASRRAITLEHAIDPRVGEIRGDERKVKQVLLNLLSNAIKFTPDGGRINVRARPRDAIVEVSVSDTGVGIAPEDQEAIFEEFRQVGTAAKRVEGTGLGLTLSRKFIELHGGRIWVESQLRTGSTFTFTVPVPRDG
jgi:signal transduction histidine kinase